MSFETDLKEAKAFEMAVARHLARAKKALLWPNGEGLDGDKDFTLFVPQKVEVKCDLKAAETGNFYFEIFNTKLQKPSGIAATKSEVVYHFVPPDRLFNYAPRYLLGALERFIRDGTAKQREGGDENSRGIIIAINTLAASGYVEEERIRL